MKWFFMMMVATVFACAILPEAAASEEHTAQAALNYLVGEWAGKFSEGEDASKYEYRGAAKLSTGGESVLKKGKWFPKDVKWRMKTYSLYQLGSEPNTLVIYWYTEHGHHFVANVTVKPQGEFFEMTGISKGVNPDGKLVVCDFSLVVRDKDHYAIKFTSRKTDGEAKPDQTEEHVRM